MTCRVLNPATTRYILIGNRTYNNLIKEGYTHDRIRNVLVSRQTNYPPVVVGGEIMSNVSLMDEKIPDIGVEPLKPTTYTTFKNAIVKTVGKMSDWLWKLAKNRSKNANNIAEWILSKKRRNSKQSNTTEDRRTYRIVKNNDI